MGPLSIAMGIAQFAPSLVRWLKGDAAGDAAERIVDTAKQVTGTLTGDDALRALRANPDRVVEFQQRALELDGELERAYLADRQNARQRDIALRQAGAANWRADVLAIGALIGLVALIWTLLFIDIPAGPARDTLLMLSGALVAIVKDVYQFEFGSSRGSKHKDGALDAIARGRS